MFSSQPIDISSFFKLGDPLANRPLRLEIGRGNYYPTNEEMFALFRGALARTNQSLRLKAYMGGQATDFLWTGLPPLVCISGRVVRLFREHKFTGWSVYPVEVYDRKGKLLPDYFGFAITGPRLKRDRSRSEIITKPPPTPTGKPYQVYKGLYFNEKEWDGNDFFLVGGSIVVTRPVRDACKKAKISNVRFTPLTEVETSVDLDKYHLP